jgi:hypothetical protein
MTYRQENAAESSTKALLEMLATIRSRAKEIYWILKESSAVAEVVDACDIEQSDDFMTGQPQYAFDVYVDATTHADNSFCWHVYVRRTPESWELDRVISGSEADVRKFEDASFKTFDELAARYSALLDEFVESARAFDFDHPHGNVADNASA